MNSHFPSPKILQLTVLSLVLAASGSSGCRLKSPSMAEQQALQAKGALTANTTDWAAAPLPRGTQTGSALDAGIPDYTRASVSIDTLSNGVMNAARPPVEVAVPEVKDPVNSVPTEESPLDRISRSCPGSDDAVRDALKTTDRGERIKRYEALTKQCPASSDLWMWLGIDYDRNGSLDDAKHAFERAVILSPANQEAKGHLSATQKKLADSMRRR